MSPRRIQRRRTKGWRMPTGAVYVGRPTKWGNPYRLGGHPIAGTNRRAGPVTAEECADAYRALFTIGAGWGQRLDLTELAGRDLACWCPLDQPCHADVLLELANGADQ